MTYKNCRNNKNPMKGNFGMRDNGGPEKQLI